MKVIDKLGNLEVDKNSGYMLFWYDVVCVCYLEFLGYCM